MSLAELFKKTRVVVEGRWYKNVIVNLDGYSFVDCRFDNCQLTYATDDFRIVRCMFDKCTVFHSPTALRFIRMYCLGFGLGSEIAGVFGPLKHADGTFSLDHTDEL